MNNIKTVFTIKDLENISGIKAHTIRIWEKRYNLFEPNRTETNIRYYSSESLLKLLNVSLLNNNNFKISKIAKLSDEEILENVKEVVFNEAIDDGAINNFKIAMFNFDKDLFNNSYRELMEQKTFKYVFREVFMPFFNEIGLYWQTKTVTPAHEHFISNLIIQKIQLNIEKLEYTSTNQDYSYVLFLPDGEIHEIGLLYINYELMLRGCQTVYLGQSLPLDNLTCFFEGNSKICFVTSMAISPYEGKVTAYLKEIDALIKETDHKLIAIGNRALEAKDSQFNSNIEIYPSLINFLNN